MAHVTIKSLKRVSMLSFGRLFLLLVLPVILAALVLWPVGDEDQRLEPIPAGADFDYEKKGLEEYIAYHKGRIASGLNLPLDSELVDKLSPFLWQPDESCPKHENGQYSLGVVLTHGLLDSPYSMRPLADFFHERCIYVAALILPGHGTRPGDLLKIGKREWLADQHYVSQEVAKRAENVILVGHSMGGTLALIEAVDNDAVKAVISFAPALKIADTAKYAKYLAWLGTLIPRAAWVAVRDDRAVYRYESLPARAVAETQAVIETAAEKLSWGGLHKPVLTVASMEDTTVDITAILEFVARQEAEDTTVLYSQYDMASPADLELHLSHKPEQGILSVSHLGLMLPPDHPHYGRNGAYRNCGHYLGEEGGLLESCSQGLRDFYGEVTLENLQTGLVERIAFNPFYTDLLKRIDDFLLSLGFQD